MARAQTSNRQRSNGRTDRAPQRKGGRSRGGDGRPERQADRYAKEAAKTADERRKKAAGGASGWVAERAGDWSLDGPDFGWMDRQKFFWNPLVDYWFRMEMEGWERLPEPPALLIGIHSGAPFVWDAWTVGIHWWRHFGEQRPLHGTAHDALMAAPLVGRYFRKMGVLPAAPDSIAAALAAGHDVALWPGGEIDSLRPWVRRDEAILAGRKGFVRTAISAGVPIVPISTVGGPDSMPVLFSGRRLAKALQLDKLARMKVFPFAVSAPWGVGPAMLPEIPLPTKIRTAFQEPIRLANDPKRAEDDDYVDRKYQEVQDSIQRGMDALARRRRLPLFG
ncbi:MAG TPA: lysophospholipid acyltransferase family protein [Solirubrobacteraceae bacterium]|jgi:1-acyl-sn-glycerol-3-phosphate acyltransferase|nr:lysophospholipid acyltransferase family protein [Solirubrobacteraceae bacterium]